MAAAALQPLGRAAGRRRGWPVARLTWNATGLERGWSAARGCPATAVATGLQPLWRLPSDRCGSARLPCNRCGGDWPAARLVGGARLPCQVGARQLIYDDYMKEQTV